MSNLGLGVLINMLGGNEETVKAVRASIGRKIKTAAAGRESLEIEFECGSKLSLWDNGQSCCESRYMTCDDKLSEFAGATVVSISIKDAPNIEAGGEEHEVQFLEVSTDRGAITCSNHNEHNGYYGGFSIAAKFTNGPLKNVSKAVAELEQAQLRERIAENQLKKQRAENALAEAIADIANDAAQIKRLQKVKA